MHCSTVSRSFHFVLDVLYTELKPLILWPDRDSLKKTMPTDFRQYCPSCIVIIDCFEIFLETATSLLARAQTYSSYKLHNTVKYLNGRLGWKDQCLFKLKSNSSLFVNSPFPFPLQLRQYSTIRTVPIFSVWWIIHFQTA